MRIRAELLSTPPRLDPVAAYLAAAACAVAAGLLRAVLGEFYEGVIPFATFYPAVFVAAFLGGFGPGALCCVLSWALAWWLWIREGGTVDSDGINFLLFIASALALAAAADFVRSVLARLAVSERRFKAAQEASLDPFVILTAVRGPAGEVIDFQVSYANEAAARSLLDGGHGLVGQSLSALGSTVLGSPEMLRRCRQVLETARPDLAQLSFGEDGRRSWFRNQAVRLEDGVAVTFRDITDSRQRQEALAASERRARDALAELDAIYVTAPIGLALLDRNLRYRRINPLLAEYNGLPPEAHIGRTITEVVPAVAEAVEAPFRRVIETRRPLRQMEVVGETRARPGEIRAWIEDANPLLSENGRIEGVVVSVTEITERKRAEAALAESEARFQQLAAAIDDVLYISEPAEHRLLYINEAYERIWGRSPTALLQDLRALHDTIHPEDRQSVVDAFVRHSTDSPFDMEYRIVRPDGEVRWIRDRGFPVASSPTAARRVAGVASDITERRQTEQARTLLMREVDHRAKNVLAVVLALVRLTKASDVETFRQILGGRIASLAQVHSLLAAGKWTGAGLRAIAEAELAAYAGRAELHGPNLLLAAGAAQSLALAFHELCTNAAKHGALSAPEGRVLLSWRTEVDGTLALSWSERGGPMVVVPERRGFGTILLEQATRYQLGADLQTAWAPEGLRVTLRIPRERYATPLDEGAGERQSPAPAAIRPDAGARRRVLVVEDNGLVAVETAQALRDVGCEVVGPEATVGAALRAVREEAALDAAVLDLDLDGTFALPVAEALSRRGVPFLLCTGFGDAAERGGALAGRPVLYKPVRPEQLAGALEALFADGTR